RCASLKSSKDKSASARAPFSSRTADSADRAGSLVWRAVGGGRGRASPSAGGQRSRSSQPRPIASDRRIEGTAPDPRRRCAPIARPSDDGVLWVHGHLLLLATRVGLPVLVVDGAPWY